MVSFDDGSRHNQNNSIATMSFCSGQCFCLPFMSVESLPPPISAQKTARMRCSNSFYSTKVHNTIVTLVSMRCCTGLEYKRLLNLPELWICHKTKPLPNQSNAVAVLAFTFSAVLTVSFKARKWHIDVRCKTLKTKNVSSFQVSFLIQSNNVFSMATNSCSWRPFPLIRLFWISKWLSRDVGGKICATQLTCEIEVCQSCERIMIAFLQMKRW